MLNEAILKIVLNDKTFSQREAEKNSRKPKPTI